MTDVRPFWETVVSSFDRLHVASIGSDAKGCCNVPVLDRSNPRAHGPGVATFRALAQEHLAAAVRTHANRGLAVPPGEAFPTAAIDRLAYYSGGVERLFLYMMLDAVGEAWSAAVTEIGDEIVDAVLLTARRAKEWRINSAQIELLERIMEDPAHSLPPGPVARTLIAEERLLVYGDDDAPWCYPNPVLTLVLLRPGRTRAGLHEVREQV
jgi:hypothetical protein